MFVEQLRCDYDVSELFEEECILDPTKPAVNSGLQLDSVSRVLSLVMGLYVSPSRCCGCGLQRLLLEETPE